MGKERADLIGASQMGGWSPPNRPSPCELALKASGTPAPYVQHFALWWLVISLWHLSSTVEGSTTTVELIKNKEELTEPISDLV